MSTNFCFYFHSMSFARAVAVAEAQARSVPVLDKTRESTAKSTRTSVSRNVAQRRARQGRLPTGPRTPELVPGKLKPNWQLPFASLELPSRSSSSDLVLELLIIRQAGTILVRVSQQKLSSSFAKLCLPSSSSSASSQYSSFSAPSLRNFPTPPRPAPTPPPESPFLRLPASQLLNAYPPSSPIALDRTDSLDTPDAPDTLHSSFPGRTPRRTRHKQRPSKGAMASKYKDKDGGVLLTFNGVWVSWLHTVVAYSMSSCLVLVSVSYAPRQSGPRLTSSPLLCLQPPSSAPSSWARLSTTTRSSRTSGSATHKNGSPPSPPQ